MERKKAMKAASPMYSYIHSNDPAIPVKEGRKGKNVATVEASILSKGVVTRAEKFEYATLCVKDWITLANSDHVGRWEQPANVQVVKPAL